MTENNWRNRFGCKDSVKRILEYISICRNLKAYQAVLSSSSDTVIKSICNAVINAFKGDIVLTRSQRRHFARQKYIVQFLVNSSKPINKKRKIIISKKSFLFIPTLLALVLNQLGNALFS